MAAMNGTDRLRAHHAQHGTVLLDVPALAAALCLDEYATRRKTCMLVRQGYLERGPDHWTFYIAPEMLPPPRRRSTRPKKRKPTAEPPPPPASVLPIDLRVLDALDLGPATLPELRRRVGVQSSLGASLARLAAAGLAVQRGGEWAAC